MGLTMDNAVAVQTPVTRLIDEHGKCVARIAELEAALRSIYAASDAATGPDDWGDLVSAAMTDDIRALVNDGN